MASFRSFRWILASLPLLIGAMGCAEESTTEPDSDGGACPGDASCVDAAELPGTTDDAGSTDLPAPVETVDTAPETTCVPDCAGPPPKVCGDDGCGGTCGSCDDGIECTDDACFGGICQSQLHGGFCLIDKLCVADGEPRWEGDPCSVCDVGATIVGWTVLGEGDSCGEGSFCHEGECCHRAENCAGPPPKVCGDDGCGGTCGECNEGEFCVDGVECSAECTAKCSGKECGPDGCGGTCGACDDGKGCTVEECTEAGVCHYEVGAEWCLIDGACFGMGEQKVVGDACTTCAPEKSAYSWTKQPDATPCGAGGVCYFGECCDRAGNCSGRECGDDGCGGECGLCPDTYTCDDAGACQPPCEPACEGKDCGEDGCGGTCGSCEGATFCNGEGICEAYSCEGQCGAPYDASLPCQCNAACIAVGDCCDDFLAECATCTDRCGDVSSAMPCQCAAGCELTESCCDDYAALCGNTCAKRCGLPQSDILDCQCDSGCLERQDCCDDFMSECVDICYDALPNGCCDIVEKNVDERYYTCDNPTGEACDTGGAAGCGRGISSFGCVGFWTDYLPDCPW